MKYVIVAVLALAAGILIADMMFALVTPQPEKVNHIRRTMRYTGSLLT
jgi:hypothetical protein